MPKTKKEKPAKIPLRKIALRILSKEEKTKEFWAREFFLLKKLIEKYPNISFWETADIKRVPSLLIYSTKDSSYLDYKYREFSFVPEKKQQIILSEKIGEDKEIISKPRTLKQFLS
jgi:hypothetical protein